MDVYIRYLRIKIDKGFEMPLILTKWGEGYMLRGADDLPDGVVAAEIDKTTGYLASPTCPAAVRTVEYFLPGTEPFLRCPLHGREQIP